MPLEDRKPALSEELTAEDIFCYHSAERRAMSLEPYMAFNLR